MYVRQDAQMGVKLKKQKLVFQHPDLYVRQDAWIGVKLKKQKPVFQHPDLYVRQSAQMGVNMNHKTDNADSINNNATAGSYTAFNHTAINSPTLPVNGPATNDSPAANDNSSVSVNPPSQNHTLNEALAHNILTGETITPYLRQAMYYETDQMAIIHHSNYIRWFEESRLYYLEQIGLGYDKLEAGGMLIPVLGVSCEYRSSVRFNDRVLILPKIKLFNGIKMTLEYQVLDAETFAVRATGESRHCFVNKDFKPINMKKNFKDMYDVFLSWLN